MLDAKDTCTLLAQYLKLNCRAGLVEAWLFCEVRSRSVLGSDVSCELDFSLGSMNTSIEVDYALKLGCEGLK